MAIVWNKWLRKSIQSLSTSRALSTLKGGPTHQIRKSHSLLLIDLPDVWTSNTIHFDDPSVRGSSNEHKARVIDGKLMAEKIRARIADEVIRMKESIGKVPGLAVILVGQRKDSQTYVRYKTKACKDVGINVVMTKLPNNCTEDGVHKALSSFNDNPSIHGIIVQLPLPNVMSPTFYKVVE